MTSLTYASSNSIIVLKIKSIKYRSHIAWPRYVTPATRQGSLQRYASGVDVARVACLARRQQTLPGYAGYVRYVDTRCQAASGRAES